jgi:hypothetical protein
MGVVRANIQTVEEIYQLIWTSIASKRPIEAVYKGLPRLFCPYRLGRNRGGEFRVLCYQYGGESERVWKHRDRRQIGVAQRCRSSAG